MFPFFKQGLAFFSYKHLATLAAASFENICQIKSKRIVHHRHKKT